MNLEAELRFLGEVGNIDMEKLTCETRAGERVSCTDIRVCTRYTGVNVELRMSKFIIYLLSIVSDK